MKRDLVMTKPLTSSFLSCEKDTETILRKLFVESRPYCDTLKRLMVIQTKDCLDEQNVNYKNIIDKFSVSKLIEEDYILLAPKIKFEEHEEKKSYLVLSFNNFTPNETNPEFRDHTITFDIVCHTDCWDIGNFQQRPLKIMGYIDGILNNSKLSGIGEVKFFGAKELIINEELSGYTLTYWVINGSDDQIPNDE